MKEGAWIEVQSGRWVWIDEHASWMQRNGPQFGLTQEVFDIIRAIPNDFGGAGRERILLAVMRSGYIRMRGHGVQVSFEFTCSMEDALRACEPILSAMAGPKLLCRFADLQKRQYMRIEYEDYLRLLACGFRDLESYVVPIPRLP